MKNLHSNLFLFLIMFVLFCMIILSCSHTKSPVDPSVGNHEPVPTVDSALNRTPLAIYNAEINPQAGIFSITPIQRSADYHFPLSQYYPNVLQVTGYGFTPNFWADIRITHPLPNSGIDGFDPRVIAILPANPGVSMNYPVMNVVGNNSVVLNHDGYTKLYDSLGGSLPGNTNPFLAYFKHVEYRRWFSSGTGYTTDTRRWEMDIDGFGGPMQFKLVVDVSLNYPDQPQQVVDNAPEPVKIDTVIDHGLNSYGGSAGISVTFLDWQGSDEIKCKIECPQLFNSTLELSYDTPGPNPNEYVFSGTISNELQAPEGIYNVLIAAWDIPTDIHIFNEAVAIVNDTIYFNPVDVTPVWLNFTPNYSAMVGNYLYAIDAYDGMKILDISNPSDPVWINHLDLPYYSGPLIVSEGNAFVTSSDGHVLMIVSVDPPQSAHIINTIDLLDSSYIECLSDGYAYLKYYQLPGFGIKIVDVEPPESAEVVKTLETYSVYDIAASNGYAYATTKSADGPRIEIIDVDPPESASIIHSYTINGSYFTLSDIEFKDGYVLASCYYDGSLPHTDPEDSLSIYDVDPPDSIHVVKNLFNGESVSNLVISNNYAYFCCKDFYSEPEVRVVNIEQVNNPVTFKTYHDISGQISADDDYMCITRHDGVKIVNIITDSITSIDTLVHPKLIEVSNNHAFVADQKGLQVLNITPPENAEILANAFESSDILDFCISGDYAYVVTGNRTHILDIEPPQSAHEVAQYWFTANSIYVSDGYAYMANFADYDGMQIFDVDPPDSANLVSWVDMQTKSIKVFVSGDYAFTTNYDRVLGYAFNIIDINPQDSAHIVKTIEFDDYISDIYAADGWAYIPSSDYLFIVDYDPANSAHIVNSVYYPGIKPWSIFVTNGLALISGESFVVVVDIDPPECAYVVETIESISGSYDIHVSDGYLYANSGDLNIIKLW